MKHECPEDPAAFFAQLQQLFNHRVHAEPPPDGYAECRICGAHYRVEPKTKES